MKPPPRPYKPEPLMCQLCGKPIRPSAVGMGWTHVRKLRLHDPAWHFARPKAEGANR